MYHIMYCFLHLLVILLTFLHFKSFVCCYVTQRLELSCCILFRSCPDLVFHSSLCICNFFLLPSLLCLLIIPLHCFVSYRHVPTPLCNTLPGP